MIKVVQVEDLQIHPARAGVGERRELGSDLIGCAGEAMLP